MGSGIEAACGSWPGADHVCSVRPGPDRRGDDSRVTGGADRHETVQKWARISRDCRPDNRVRAAWTCGRWDGEAAPTAIENPYGPFSLKGSPAPAQSLADGLVDGRAAQSDHTGDFGHRLALPFQLPDRFFLFFGQQLEDLRQETQTKEQRLAHERKQLEEHFGKKLTEATKAREEWERRFRAETVERDLLDAAVAGEAFNADTVMAVLRPLSHLEEIADEKGKATGRFRTVVAFPSTDPDTGEPVVMPLTAKKAVQQMQAEATRYGNLFKSGVVSGIGSSAGIGKDGKADARCKRRRTPALASSLTPNPP